MALQKETVPLTYLVNSMPPPDELFNDIFGFQRKLFFANSERQDVQNNDEQYKQRSSCIPGRSTSSKGTTATLHRYRVTT